MAESLEPTESAAACPSPDEIDFDRMEEYPDMGDDFQWLMKAWKDVNVVTPSSAARRPLYQRGYEPNGIRDVWSRNLCQEFDIIRYLVVDYPNIAIDTEFPGFVMRPIGTFKSSSDYQYETLRCNVDMLRIIQLGLTFLDKDGNTPPGPCTTWQFNFKFDINVDAYAQDSIDLLRKSGIQFWKHELHGINATDFAELLISSDIALNSHISWLSYHSVFDFGYLLKLLTNKQLPPLQCDFFNLLRYYFPCFYDIKHMVKSWNNIHGGLEDIANFLQVERLGTAHQAGSDSLLMGRVFFKIRKLLHKHNMTESLHMCRLYGLNITGEGTSTGEEQVSMFKA